MAEAGIQSLWNQLVGEDLSGINFVRDYLQLQFDPPPLLNVYSSQIIASVDGRSAAFGEEGFANLAIGLIGKVVSGVKVDKADFRILFEHDAEIRISLRAEHYVGPEVLEFRGRDDRTAVV